MQENVSEQEIDQGFEKGKYMIEEVARGSVHVRSYRAKDRFGFYSKRDENPDRNFEQASVLI